MTLELVKLGGLNRSSARSAACSDPKLRKSAVFVFSSRLRCFVATQSRVQAQVFVFLEPLTVWEWADVRAPPVAQAGTVRCGPGVHPPEGTEHCSFAAAFHGGAATGIRTHLRQF